MKRPDHRSLLDKFDVKLVCPCGHRAIVQVREHPDFTRVRWTCSQCGGHDPSVEVWPIWSRAFRGQMTLED